MAKEWERREPQTLRSPAWQPAHARARVRYGTGAQIGAGAQAATRARRCLERRGTGAYVSPGPPRFAQRMRGAMPPRPRRKGTLRTWRTAARALERVRVVGEAGCRAR
jgi:hypothetical protein